MRSRLATRTSGFTLIEVLAAAMVLVLVGTIAIGSISADLSRMSDARLRLEAGRIADTALADIEGTLFDGSAPALFDDENEFDGFTVKTRVAPFGTLFRSGGGAAPVDEAETGGGGLFQVIAGEFPGLPRHLRRIEVQVLWGDPRKPDSVIRTTVGFDHTTALEMLENSLNQAEGDEE